MDTEIIDYAPDIIKISDFLSAGSIEEAKIVAKSMPKRIKQKKIENARYTYNKENKNKGKYNKQDIMNILIRDGFIDRYTGLKLVIPPALRLISEIIPDEFPYHPNWKEGCSHDCYWDLSATLDHVTCLANQGTDEISNLISTSMSKNLQKNSIPFETLEWSLFEKGNIKEWDGLSTFYLNQYDKNPKLLKKKYFRDWYSAVKKALNDHN